MKHIVQFSGGKDSTAMLLMMLERGMQVDEIIFCDTGKEFPQMYDHIKKVEEYIGRKVTVLKADKSFDYYMFECKKTRGKHMDVNGYGWAGIFSRWCTGLLKQDVSDKYTKNKYGDVMKYVGIALDEPKRHERKPPFVAHPLVEWRITEKDALEYCYKKGFNWGGLYEVFDRVSCWCCPLANLKQLRAIYVHFPNLWAELKEMDRKSHNQFRKDYSVEQLETRFKREFENEARAISLFEEGQS